MAKAFLEYLSTGIKPIQQVGETEPSFDFFRMDAVSDLMPKIIKSEEKQQSERVKAPRVRVISHAVIDRETVLGNLFPAGEIAQERGNVVQLEEPPILDVDHHSQKSADYQKLNDTLMKAASETAQKYLFGLCNLTRCGQYWQDAAHAIVFYATETRVVYIDCQKAPDAIIENLSDCYRFIGQENVKGATANTFSNFVFYAPVVQVEASHTMPEATLKALDNNENNTSPEPINKASVSNSFSFFQEKPLLVKSEKLDSQPRANFIDLTK